MRLYKPTRPDGTKPETWYFDVAVNGKRHRGSTKIQDKKAAREFVDCYVSRLRLGLPVDEANEAETPSLKQYALQYVERSKARKVTWRDDESALRRLWTPTLGGKRLHEVLPGDVELILKRRIEGLLQIAGGRVKKPKPRTVEQEKAILHSMFNMAIQDGLIERNPVKGVKVKQLRHIDNQRTETFSDSEVGRLLQHTTKGSSIRVMIVLADQAGMRQGEIRKLEWEWIDLRAGVVRLPKTKNGDRRAVPLTESAEQELQAWRWGRAGQRYVFPSRNDPDKPIRQGSVTQAFRRVCKRAEVTYGQCVKGGKVFHDFRHTFSTRQAKARGVNIVALARITGHRDPKMLLRYYNPTEKDLVALVRGKSTATMRHMEGEASGEEAINDA